MATYDLRGQVRAVNVAQAGQIGFHRVEIDLATLEDGPGLANEDIVLFDGPPRGHKLVPELFRVAGPEFDSHGSPTATFKVGTDASDANIIAAAVGGVGAPHVLNQAPNVPAAYSADIGSKTADTGLRLTVTAAVATAAETGVLVVFVPYTPFAD